MVNHLREHGKLII